MTEGAIQLGTVEIGHSEPPWGALRAAVYDDINGGGLVWLDIRRLSQK